MESTWRCAAAILLCSPAWASAQLPDWLAKGERLTYALSYFKVVGGTMTLEAAMQPGGDRFRLGMRALSGEFVSKFATVDDQLETMLDPGRVTVLLSQRKTREVRHRAEERVEFDPEKGVARRWRNGEEKTPLKVPTPVLDTLASLYYLRTLPLAPGRAFQFDVQEGGEVYPLVVVVTERRVLKTDAGKVETFVVEPRFRGGGLLKKEGKLTMFVTTDAAHTPVRIASVLPIGSLTANLTLIERPWQRVVESGRGSEGNGKE